MLRLLLGLLVTIGALYYALRDIDCSTLLNHLFEADPLWMFLALLVFLLHYPFKALRWNLLVADYSPMSFRESLTLNTASVFCVMVIPFRIGEFFRPFAMQRRQGANPFTVFVSCMMERVLDGLVLALFFFLTLAFGDMTIESIPGTTLSLTGFGYLALGGFGAVLILFVLFAAFGETSLAILHRLAHYLPTRLAATTERTGEGLLVGVKILARRGRFIGVILYTFLFWLNLAVFTAICMQAMGIVPTWSNTFFTASLVVLGNTIPAAPGFIGTFQFFCRIALVAHGVPADLAVAFSLLYHAIQMVLILPLGGLALSVMSIGRKALGSMTELDLEQSQAPR